jgi:glucose-1-phosphate thymidylyltransferase
VKGIILAGGSGSRLYPMTVSVNKQLIPVYDKPMIYYPLANLISFGIREICIVSSPEFIDKYKKLFNDGSHLGLDISYRIQPEPKGIAQALIIAEDFINNENVCLILGDNIFHGVSDIEIAKTGATVFGYEVSNPSAYGVVSFDSSGNPTSMEEKPLCPTSKYAMPGLYFYDKNAVKYAKSLIPSDRGELEITHLNRLYLEKKEVTVIKLKKGTVWLDAGTPESLFQSSAYIQAIQSRQGTMVGCIEEECLKKHFIDKSQLINLIHEMPNSEYRTYLSTLFTNE